MYGFIIRAIDSAILCRNCFSRHGQINKNTDNYYNLNKFCQHLFVRNMKDVSIIK